MWKASESGRRREQLRAFPRCTLRSPEAQPPAHGAEQPGSISQRDREREARQLASCVNYRRQKAELHAEQLPSRVGRCCAGWAVPITPHGFPNTAKKERVYPAQKTTIAN